MYGRLIQNLEDLEDLDESQEGSESHKASFSSMMMPLGLSMFADDFGQLAVFPSVSLFLLGHGVFLTADFCSSMCTNPLHYKLLRYEAFVANKKWAEAVALYERSSNLARAAVPVIACDDGH